MKYDYSLYLVTDRNCMSTSSLNEAVTQAISGGCTMVQLREKGLSASAFYRQAVEIKRISEQYNIPLIINDRIDIAMAVKADGVHIGQSDIPPNITRELIGTDMLLGVSVTTVKEAVRAVKEGADYLGVGAIFPTATKMDATLVSIEELQKIRQSVNIPIVAIGGINKDNAKFFKPMGIDGIAVISAVIAQPDIANAAAELKSAFIGKAHNNV